jgi:hypothetical protein
MYQATTALGEIPKSVRNCGHFAMGGTALVLVGILWHKPGMSIFLERFVITVLCGIFLVVIGFGTSLKWDTQTRVCLCIIVITGAYLAAHIIEIQRNPRPSDTEPTQAISSKTETKSTEGEPEIWLNAPALAMNGVSTVADAVPIYKRQRPDNRFEGIIQFRNVGKQALTNALVRVEIPSDYNLKCTDRDFYPIAGNPKSGRWRNIIDVNLGTLRPDGPPTKITLEIEYMPEEKYSDFEVQCTMFGDQFPGDGKPVGGQKLCFKMASP